MLDPGRMPSQPDDEEADDGRGQRSAPTSSLYCVAKSNEVGITDARG